MLFNTTNQSHQKFFRIYNKLQESDDGSKRNRLFGFFRNLSYKYNLQQEEVNYIGLMKILEISKKIKIKDEKALEAYIWKSIRNGIKSYIQKEQSAFKFWQWHKSDDGKYYKSKAGFQLVDLDDQYGIYDDSIADFELKYDIGKMFSKLQGRDWRLANLIYIFGNRIDFLCNVMKITKEQYVYSLDKIKLCLADGYA